MGGFFNIDGAFHRYASLVTDIVIISVLWIMFSWPIITMGAATTAAYYVCTKKASGREGYLLAGFFKSFKENFLKATAATLLLLLVGGILVLNMSLLDDEIIFANIILVVQYFLLVQLVFVGMYVFPLIARFEMKLGQVFRAGFLLANRHLLLALGKLAMVFALIFASIYFPLLIIFAGGIYIYISSFIFVRVFRKHYPQFDPIIEPEE